jgi:predicted DsbA family dithiol-disulfide isomerase
LVASSFGRIRFLTRPAQADLPAATRRWPTTLNATPDDLRLALTPLDESVDHIRGSSAGRLILEYGDYECPYSRQAFHAIEHVEQQLRGNMRFAFRHFPLTSIHPHALAAAAAAEAAALQGRFWDMHGLLFYRQKALGDGDLSGYAAELGLDVAAFDRDRASSAVADRIRRDVDSGLASGQVLGTPTLFIDGVVHRGGYDPPTLLAALAPLAAGSLGQLGRLVVDEQERCVLRCDEVVCERVAHWGAGHGSLTFSERDRRDRR